MRIWLAAVVLLTAAAQVSAQQADRRRQQFDREIERARENYFEKAGGLALTERMRVNYGAYTTLSFLSADNEDRTTSILRQTDTKFWADARVAGHSFYGRLRLRYRDFNTHDGFTMSDDDLTQPIGDRYSYRFDFRQDQRAETGQDPGWNFWVQMGRQYINWFSGLVLSETLFATEAGVEIGRWKIRGFLGNTPRTGTIDLDGSRPNFDADVDRLFWGAGVEYLGFASHRPYAYVVGQNDNNGTTIAGVRWFYDSFYVAVGSTGQIVTGEWFYRVEFIYENGDSASDTLGAFPQTIDDIEAWAGRIMVGYLPRGSRLKWRFELEVLVGSGDDDRLHATHTVGGNLSGTKDHSFNAFGFTNTGLVLAPEISNLISVRLGAGFSPMPRREMRLRVDVYLFSKMEGDAPLSVESTNDTFLGVEVDFSMSWNITSDTSWDLQYGIFVPGDATSADNPMHLFYTGFSYGF